MGQTFHLQCEPLKVYCWIGQNTMGTPGILPIFYSTTEHLGRLQRFLIATYGKPLVMVEANGVDYDCKEFEGEYEDTRWEPPASGAEGSG